MNFMRPFAPHYGSTQTVSPAAPVAPAVAVSATVAITASDEQVRIINSGANIAYIRTGNSANGAIVASAADFPIAAGTSAVITKSVMDDTLAYISPAGTTLAITTGNGF